MRVYHTNPDRGDKIYFIHCLLWVSLPETTKSEACRNAICYLFCKTVLFFLSPCSSGGPIRGGALMKADSQPDAGCERWSKAGRTNVCTHTSTLSLPARGDVKHDDVGRSWRRALCLPLPSQEAQKFSCEDAESYVWIHGSHRHTCTLIWMTTKRPTNLIQAVTGTITCF